MIDEAVLSGKMKRCRMGESSGEVLDGGTKAMREKRQRAGRSSIAKQQATSLRFRAGKTKSRGAIHGPSNAVIVDVDIGFDKKPG
jgi:hypothetical protein